MDPLASTLIGAIVGALVNWAFQELLDLAAGKARRKRPPSTGKHFRRP